VFLVSFRFEIMASHVDCNRHTDCYYYLHQRIGMFPRGRQVGLYNFPANYVRDGWEELDRMRREDTRVESDIEVDIGFTDIRYKPKVQRHFRANVPTFGEDRRMVYHEEARYMLKEGRVMTFSPPRDTVIQGRPSVFHLRYDERDKDNNFVLAANGAAPQTLAGLEDLQDDMNHLSHDLCVFAWSRESQMVVQMRFPGIIFHQTEGVKTRYVRSLETGGREANESVDVRDGVPCRDCILDEDDKDIGHAIFMRMEYHSDKGTANSGTAGGRRWYDMRSPVKLTLTMVYCSVQKTAVAKVEVVRTERDPQGHRIYVHGLAFEMMPYKTLKYNEFSPSTNIKQEEEDFPNSMEEGLKRCREIKEKEEEETAKKKRRLEAPLEFIDLEAGEGYDTTRRNIHELEMSAQSE
jgi:hypothetical protein